MPIPYYKSPRDDLILNGMEIRNNPMCDPLINSINKNNEAHVREGSLFFRDIIGTSPSSKTCSLYSYSIGLPWTEPKHRDVTRLTGSLMESSRHSDVVKLSCETNEENNEYNTVLCQLSSMCLYFNDRQINLPIHNDALYVEENSGSISHHHYNMKMWAESSDGNGMWVQTQIISSNNKCNILVATDPEMIYASKLAEEIGKAADCTVYLLSSDIDGLKVKNGLLNLCIDWKSEFCSRNRKATEQIITIGKAKGHGLVFGPCERDHHTTCYHLKEYNDDKAFEILKMSIYNAYLCTDNMYQTNENSETSFGLFSILLKKHIGPSFCFIKYWEQDLTRTAVGGFRGKQAYSCKETSVRDFEVGLYEPEGFRVKARNIWDYYPNIQSKFFDLKKPFQHEIKHPRFFRS
ncbi:hypothetical protein 3 [Spheniscid alphaherpesvirus 1]|uniref:Uncharacterized protein n=1 Tax=Spheniscid alphaherpesvirus 1 TaxID=2560777 RepID=A0A1R3TEB5_9ALPH|nr:hypothetical protein 3 [Spheniscid alphaherpesvirus 1]